MTNTVSLNLAATSETVHPDGHEFPVALEGLLGRINIKFEVEIIDEDQTRHYPGHFEIRQASDLDALIDLGPGRKEKIELDDYDRKQLQNVLNRFQRMFPDRFKDRVLSQIERRCAV